MVLLTLTISMIHALDQLNRLEILPDKSSQCLQDQEGFDTRANGNTEFNKDVESNQMGQEDRRATPSSGDKMRQIQLRLNPVWLYRASHLFAEEQDPAEPELSDPKIGNPITHSQIMGLSREMKTRGLEPCHLETLLRGTKVYIPPSLPKAEPTSEYKALMARLRREKEARNYERMLNPPPPQETFSQRFPAASAAHAFSSNHLSTSDEKDDNTYADVDRQMMLIFNVLVSIVACAAAIWIAARWWSTPMRLALSMSGSLLVCVAEVVVYSGYIRRVSEAKGKEKAVKEVKEVVRSWVVGSERDVDLTEEHHDLARINSKPVPANGIARRRK